MSRTFVQDARMTGQNVKETRRHGARAGGHVNPLYAGARTGDSRDAPTFVISLGSAHACDHEEIRLVYKDTESAGIS
jgi:hypothetical protein